VKLEGAEAIQELQRVADMLQQPTPSQAATKPARTSASKR